MAEENKNSPASSRMRKQDQSQWQELCGYKERVAEDDKHIMAKENLDNHFKYVEQLEKQGKRVPDSCIKCLKEVLLMQQRQPDKSKTNLSDPVSPTTLVSDSSRKRDSEKSSFFDVSSDNIDVTTDESYAESKMKKEWHVVSAPPDLKKADLEKLKAKISEGETCSCIDKEDVVIKRLNNYLVDDDKECFLVKRKRCIHELDKEKKTQSEFRSLSHRNSDTEMSDHEIEGSRVINYKVKEEVARLTANGQEKPVDENYDLEKSECSCSKLHFDSDDNRLPISSTVRLKCKMHPQSDALICSKEDSDLGWVSRTEGESKKSSDCYKSICAEAAKGRKRPGLEDSLKSDRIRKHDAKLECEETLDVIEKISKPVKHSEKIIEKPADEPKRNESVKKHCITVCKVIKKHSNNEEESAGKELIKKSSRERYSVLECCCSTCNLENYQKHSKESETEASSMLVEDNVKINDKYGAIMKTRENEKRAKESETEVSSVLVEDNVKINDKYEAIMKTREIVWGNNIPPELILENTTYARRHASCCVGNKKETEFEYIPRYVCPKYGDHKVAVGESEQMYRKNAYEHCKFKGTKELYDGQNMRQTFCAALDPNNCPNSVDATAAKKQIQKNKQIVSEKCSGEQLQQNKPIQDRKIQQRVDTRVERDVERLEEEKIEEKFGRYKRKDDRPGLNYPFRHPEDAEMVDKNPQTRKMEVHYQQKQDIPTTCEQIRAHWSKIQRCEECDSLIQNDAKLKATKRYNFDDCDDKRNSSKYRIRSDGQETSLIIGGDKCISLCCHKAVESEEVVSEPIARSQRRLNEDSSEEEKVEEMGKLIDKDDFKSMDRSEDIIMPPPIPDDRISTEVTKSLSNCCKLLNKCLSLISEKELKNKEIHNLPTSQRMAQKLQAISQDDVEGLGNISKEINRKIQPSQDTHRSNFCIDVNCIDYCIQQKSQPSGSELRQELKHKTPGQPQNVSRTMACKDSLGRLREELKMKRTEEKFYQDSAQCRMSPKSQKEPLQMPEKAQKNQEENCCDCSSCQCTSQDKSLSMTTRSDGKCCDQSCKCSTKCKK